MAENVHLKIGNRPVALGRLKALAELEKLIGAVGEMNRVYMETFRSPDMIVVETILRLFGREVHEDVPCAMIARSEAGLMVDVRFYLDLSSLGS